MKNKKIIQPLSLLLANNLRRRSRIKYGMISSYISGFTLIELLVVVLIIGILAAVALPQYQKAVYKSRYATLKQLTRSMAQAQETYYLENGEYANNFEQLVLDMPHPLENKSTNSTYHYTWGFCQLFNHPEQNDVYCYNAEIGLWFQIFLSHSPQNANRHMCVANHTLDLNHIRNQICKAETNGVGTKSSKANYTTWFYK